MTFLDHLEQLRWHVVRAVIGIFVMAIVAYVGKEFLIDGLLLGPIQPDFITFQWLCLLGNEIDSAEVFCVTEIPVLLQNRTPTGQFTMDLLVAGVAGFIMAFPYVFWEIWRFIRPGLYPQERKRARGATFWVSLLFMVGVTFGYLVVSPLSMNFLSNYVMSDAIENYWDIRNYVQTIVMIILACAIMFQLPMAALFLSRAGLLTPQVMVRFRRHSYVVILILSAIITPPDIISQLLLGVPLFFLYELSIIISRRVWKKRAKKEQKEIERLREKNLENLV